MLRGSVHLPPDRELALLEAKITADILREQPDIKPSELSALLAARQQTEPLRGLGNLLLVPWRQADADDAILELRAAWFLPGQRIDLSNATVRSTRSKCSCRVRPNCRRRGWSSRTPSHC